MNKKINIQSICIILLWKLINMPLALGLPNFSAFSNSESANPKSYLVGYAIASGPGTQSVANSDIIHAWPNPARTYTSFHYRLSDENQHAIIVIRNLVGAVVHTEVLQYGSDMIRINTSDFEEGIYIYTLIIDNKIITSKRLVIIN